MFVFYLSEEATAPNQKTSDNVVAKPPVMSLVPMTSKALAVIQTVKPADVFATPSKPTGMFVFIK
jgi:hypothetical protein